MNIIEACKKYKKIMREGWQDCYILVKEGCLFLYLSSKGCVTCKYKRHYLAESYHLTREDILASDWKVYKSLKRRTK